MFTLIIGGAASGKSEYAETLVEHLEGRRVYLATMQPFDEECRERIAKHREMRRSKDFSTIECYTNLAEVCLPEDSNVLLECMSNLVANELYSPNGKGTEAILCGVHILLARCRNLTIVTNEVFSGGEDYAGDTGEYLRQLALVNRTLAAEADNVMELVAGLANILKGKEICAL
ncbi:MAG: bifunctional adenosylcobinamide kinase/adenosylcobinamide-phosphate guanylyltransferase [Angelakisella sp.]